MGYKVEMSIKSNLPISAIYDSLHGYMAKRYSDTLVMVQPTNPYAPDMNNPCDIRFSIQYESTYPMTPNEFMNALCGEMELFVAELEMRGAKDVEKTYRYDRGVVQYQIFSEQSATKVYDPALEAAKLKTEKHPPHYNDPKEHICDINEVPEYVRVRH